MKKPVILSAYKDMDGGVAAAICLAHLKKVQKGSRSPTQFQIVPVAPPQSRTSSCLFLRENFEQLEIPQNLIEKYEDFLDCVALAKTFKDRPKLIKKGNFLSLALRLKALFNCQNPLINTDALYISLVEQIAQNACVEELFDSNDLYYFLT